jgi:hypothetical protein
MKYLGSTLVEEAEDSQSYGDGVITKALQSIIAMVYIQSIIAMVI